ncbi:transcriptional regulator, AraC family [Calothrix sp. PCC 7716]|nr:transcriptional regulator, AraC family [Calothrix sp. PCC 7716]
MKEATFSISLIRNSVQYAAAVHGIDTNRLCAAAGIDPSLLTMPDSYVSGETNLALWHEVVKQTGDADIGLHMGEKFNLSVIGIVGYVLFNCQTFGQVLDKLSRYMCLFSQGVSMHYNVSRGQVVCEWEIVNHLKNYLVEEPRQPIEASFSALLTAAKTLTGKSLCPREVWFQYNSPDNISEHQRIFEAPVYFSQSKNQLVFDAACLEWSVVSANPSLLLAFEQHAQAMLFALSNENTYSYQVVREITNHLKGEVPSIELIARSLTISVRNLQRELQTEGTSYQQLLDNTRKELALRYLKKPDTSIHDVAFLLGFSEPSAFHRAFKRWTGQTPRAYFSS